MKTPNDILEFINDNARDLSQDDLVKVDEAIDANDQIDDFTIGMIYEAIALIVNAPEYEGDCSPID